MDATVFGALLAMAVGIVPPIVNFVTKEWQESQKAQRDRELSRDQREHDRRTKLEDERREVLQQAMSAVLAYLSIQKDEASAEEAADILRMRGLAVDAVGRACALWGDPQLREDCVQLATHERSYDSTPSKILKHLQRLGDSEGLSLKGENVAPSIPGRETVESDGNLIIRITVSKSFRRGQLAAGKIIASSFDLSTNWQKLTHQQRENICSLYFDRRGENIPKRFGLAIPNGKCDVYGPGKDGFLEATPRWEAELDPATTPIEQVLESWTRDCRAAVTGKEDVSLAQTTPTT